MKVKTIDINVKEWYDKINGNFYFAGTISINFGMKNQKNINLPYQYGYGEHYIDMAKKKLQELNIIPSDEHNGFPALWRYCKENNIILRTTKKENCRKKELMFYND